MEGNYKQIFTIKAANNDPAYNHYLEKFDNAIRFQIARSAEKSYESLKVNDALQMLMLNNLQELSRFISEESDTLENKEIDWKVNNDRLFFNPVNICFFNI